MVLVWSFSNIISKTSVTQTIQYLILYYAIFNVSQFVRKKIEKIPCFTSDFKAMLVNAMVLTNGTI